MKKVIETVIGVIVMDAFLLWIGVIVVKTLL